MCSGENWLGRVSDCRFANAEHMLPTMGAFWGFEKGLPPGAIPEGRELSYAWILIIYGPKTRDVAGGSLQPHFFNYYTLEASNRFFLAINGEGASVSWLMKPIEN